MTYEAWRISYQSSEQAARAAYSGLQSTSTRLHEAAVACANAEAERDALRAELDALKSREGEVVYRWLALDYSGFCYGSNPPDNLPNRCNLKAFYAPAEVAP